MPPAAPLSPPLYPPTHHHAHQLGPPARPPPTLPSTHPLPWRGEGRAHAGGRRLHALSRRVAASEATGGRAGGRGTVVVDAGHAIEELEDADGGADGLHELGEDGQQRLEREHRLPMEIETRSFQMQINLINRFLYKPVSAFGLHQRLGFIK
jgi:hypothetical protein